MNTARKQLWATDGLLLTTAAIWGFAFTAQRAGMAYIGPFTYNAIRFTLGALTLVPFMLLSPARPTAPAQRQQSLLRSLIPSLAIGAFLFAGSSLQQIGIVYTTAGKAGFITGLYVVLVPLFGRFAGAHTERGKWAGAILAAIGLYFLSVSGSLSFERGDFLVFLSAFFFAGHVLLLSRFSPGGSALKLAFIQYVFCGFASGLVALVTETASTEAVVQAWLPIAYGGVFSVGIAYSLQVVAQKTAHPAHAVILLSLEGAFAAVGGYFVLGEILSPRDLLGCALMLAGMLVSQATALRTLRSRSSTASLDSIT